jgi:hypothetical protein
MRLLMLALLAALGCESKTSKPAPEPEPTRPAADAGPVAASDSAAPTASTSALGAWLAAHPANGKRIKAENIDKATRAELVDLGKSVVDEGYRDRPARLRWARALSPTAAAFSIGYQPESDKDRVSVYAVAVIEGGAAARSGASVRIPEHADGGTEFQADVDADNDGLDDPVVSYQVSQSGGGESTQGGIIIMGSRGSTIDIDTMSRDAEFAAGPGGNYAHSTDPVVLCWTKIGAIAALISASSTERDPVYEPGKKPSWDLQVYGADERGVLGELEVSARVVKSGPMAKLATRASTLVGKTAFETPACAGPLIVPDLAGSFRQVTDLAIGPPVAGRVALGTPNAK